jgi:hypothetical protein
VVGVDINMEAKVKLGQWILGANFGAQIPVGPGKPIFEGGPFAKWLH